MFQHQGISCHECGSHGAKDLPEWKIPRHDRQQHAKRLEENIAALEFRFDFGRGKEFARVFGKVIATEGALFQFGTGLVGWLAHFACHENGMLFLVTTENGAGPTKCHRCGRHIFAPGSLRHGRSFESSDDRFLGVFRIVGNQFVAGRID